MSEKELKREISRTFERAKSADDAMTAAAELLGRELGEVRIFTLTVPTGLGDRRVTTFLESRDFPFRGAYAGFVTAAASVVLLVGAWQVPQPSMQMLAEHVARELSLFGTKGTSSGHIWEAA